IAPFAAMAGTGSAMLGAGSVAAAPFGVALGAGVAAGIVTGSATMGSLSAASPVAADKTATNNTATEPEYRPLRLGPAT
ncbi:hypothetical protein, partial [Nocardia altamirensis]|uniref:hypothetical protein n=1 Tax=Nocardia altamirensis TaxID=472158 RepID=UPI000A66579D